MRVSEKNTTQMMPSILEDAPHPASCACCQQRVRLISFEKKSSLDLLEGTNTSGKRLQLKNAFESNGAPISKVVIDMDGKHSWTQNGDINDSFNADTKGFVVQDPFNSAGWLDENNSPTYGLDDLISDLLKKSPTFKQRVEETLEFIGVDKIHIAISLDGEHTAGYVRGDDPVIYISPSILATDANGNITPALADPEEAALILIHELGHLDPRNAGKNGDKNETTEDNNVFLPGSNTADSTDGDHDPQHSQYVMGIMNEYLKKTGQSYEQGATYLNTGLPANLDDDDYSVDSLFDKDKILDERKVGSPQTSLRTVYNRILKNLSDGKFDKVTDDLQMLRDEKTPITRTFQNPQGDASQVWLTYKLPVLDWMTDLLVKETFDNRLGEMDTVLEADERLKQNLGKYYNYAKQNGNTTITTSLRKSAEKFFLSFEDIKSEGKVVNPADFNTIEADMKTAQGDIWKAIKDKLSLEEKNKAIAILKLTGTAGKQIDTGKYAKALTGMSYDELSLVGKDAIENVVTEANKILNASTGKGLTKNNVDAIANILCIDNIGDIDSDKFYTEQFNRQYVTAAAKTVAGEKNFKEKYTLLPNETARLGKMASSTQAHKDNKDKVEMVYRLTTGDTKTLNENALSELYFGEGYTTLTYAQQTMIQFMKKAAEGILQNKFGVLNTNEALQMANALGITAGTGTAGDAFFDYDKFNAFRLALGKFLNDYWKDNYWKDNPTENPSPIDLAGKFNTSLFAFLKNIKTPAAKSTTKIQKPT